jgi:hypothetical protein
MVNCRASPAGVYLQQVVGLKSRSVGRSVSESRLMSNHRSRMAETSVRDSAGGITVDRSTAPKSAASGTGRTGSAAVTV